MARKKAKEKWVVSIAAQGGKEYPLTVALYESCLTIKDDAGNSVRLGKRKKSLLITPKGNVKPFYTQSVTPGKGAKRGRKKK
ncbi:MAG: hypothetical protein AB1665_05200 [Candidatus Thermoplasmatota archaeon]